MKSFQLYLVVHGMGLRSFITSSISPLLKFHRNLGEFPCVRNCAPADVQENFGGNLGMILRNFRSGIVRGFKSYSAQHRKIPFVQIQKKGLCRGVGIAPFSIKCVRVWRDYNGFPPVAPPSEPSLPVSSSPPVLSLLAEVALSSSML